jgi:hypothetical protein
MTELTFPPGAPGATVEGWEWETPPGRWQRKTGGSGARLAHYADFISGDFSDGHANAAAWCAAHGNLVRPSPKWVRNASGLLEAVTGTNTPAIWAGKGLLLEPASQNYAGSDSGNWSIINPTDNSAGFGENLTATYQGPTGANDAASLGFAPGPAHHMRARTPNVTHSNVVLSMCLKAVGNIRYVFVAYPTADNQTTPYSTTSPTAWTIFDLHNGSHTQGQSHGGGQLPAGIEPIGNDWFWCWHVRGNNPVNTMMFQIGPSTATITTGGNSVMQVPFTWQAGDAIHLWGLQPEPAAAGNRPATSTMGRGAVTSPRTADSFNIPAAGTAATLKVNGVTRVGADTGPPFNLVLGTGFGFLESVEWE